MDGSNLISSAEIQQTIHFNSFNDDDWADLQVCMR